MARIGLPKRIRSGCDNKSGARVHQCLRGSTSSLAGNRKSPSAKTMKLPTLTLLLCPITALIVPVLGRLLRTSPETFTLGSLPTHAGQPGVIFPAVGLGTGGGGYTGQSYGEVRVAILKARFQCYCLLLAPACRAHCAQPNTSLS